MSGHHPHPAPGAPAPATAAQKKSAHLDQCSDDAKHEEALLDKAVENTFPASDPIAEVPAKASSTKVIDSEDAELDKAIEMTFPASDPIAVNNITKVVPEKK